MFSKAYPIASQYTFPLLISSRHYDGSVESGLGSFVILNAEGWILTAAHILNTLLDHHQHLSEIQAYNANPVGNPNPKWIVNHSMWFGADPHRIEKFHILKENDIAIGKIENFDANQIKNYPKFVNPERIMPGTSLCKLGYPFYNVQAIYDETTNLFRYDPKLFPIPNFPIDGMATRILSTGQSPDKVFEYKWIETSTPGLKGQSGGPIFDAEGNIWAIQSQTQHLQLGFAPKVNLNGQEHEEHQFLNVGWGAHVDTILKFLKQYNVSYNQQLS